MWMVFGVWAASPAVQVSADGALVGVVSLAAAPDVVAAVLADPVHVALVHDAGATVAITSQDGLCLLTSKTSPSPLKTVRYTTKLCPVDDGFEENLIASDTFETYAVRWTLASEALGTRLTYRFAATANLPVPAFIRRRVSRRSTEKLLENLQTHFEAKP